MVQADDLSLQRLLEVQAEDTAIKRLTDRRSSLPEAARLAEVNDTLAELSADIDIARKQRDEIAREQTRIEAEIASLEQKVQREEQRMYSGNVSNPKELASLQAEVGMLRKKRAGLEDELLEVMVQKDQATETLDSLQSEQREATAEGEQLGDVVGRLTAEIDAELEGHRTKRAELVASIPQDLLGLYEQLRAGKNGVGAAALRDGTCQGCHTKLPAREVERMRAERGLQRCDNCRRILIVV